ncbi:arrestin domain-containing protein 3-like isoform X2 [Chiloscyllium plagiosum]|uniref:arrestin domain-containing protein 3-like isoform X2 n=1 Tax=Chiloscyllium plagiosum TaxID=36176 RepID=UPI001CB7BC68|nr:arrestin domain-containing protein 3-like isoform X2 [Chiloscyllium plagiosum]
MGKVTSFTILYDRAVDNNIPTYSCGEWVSGRIIVELNAEIEVKALKIHAKGQAYVHWTERHRSGSNSNTTRHYTQQIRYFKHKYLLIGVDGSEQLTVLPPGRHEYPFSLVLPHSPPLPATFKGPHGNVSYWMTAKLHRPWKLRIKVKEMFTVLDQIDINVPSLLSPQSASEEKTICCCCCASGPISLSAKIERKGYTSGESIRIFAEIENNSSRKLVPKAAIYKTQIFHAEGKKKTVTELVTKIEGEPVLAGKSENWNGMELKIPAVPPTLMNCSIIQMEYSLMIYLDVPSSFNLDVKLPIVIGTIPLHPVNNQATNYNTQYGMNYNTFNNFSGTLPEGPDGKPGFLFTNENPGFQTPGMKNFQE